MFRTYDCARFSAAAAKVLLPPPGDYVPLPAHALARSIVERFEQQVELAGDRIAIKTPQGELSYRELNRTANRIARVLLARFGSGLEPALLLMEKEYLHFAAI